MARKTGLECAKAALAQTLELHVDSQPGPPPRSADGERRHHRPVPTPLGVGWAVYQATTGAVAWAFWFQSQGSPDIPQTKSNYLKGGLCG